MALGLLPAVLLILLFAAAVDIVNAELAQDRAALVAFFETTPHENRIHWDANSSACDWVGVTCDANRTAVRTLRLPAVGLLGPIAAGTIGRLSSLRVLSLRSNGLSGPIPADFAGLTRLRSLYLQDNLFSGEIPPDLAKMTGLVHLDLSGNNLTGEIPFSLNNLTRLTHLFLQRNGLSGTIPSIGIASLEQFNVSCNRLNGSIPESLRRFPWSSFVGNLNLCDGPLLPCSPFFPSPAVSSLHSLVKKRKLSTAAIIGIVGVVAALGLGLLFLCWAFRRCMRANNNESMFDTIRGGASTSGTASAGALGDSTSGSSTSGTAFAARLGDNTGGASTSGTASAGTADRWQMVFLGQGKGRSLSLQDLVEGPVNFLGKGSRGASYKVTLKDGTAVAVKRLDDVRVSARAFDAQMEMLGQVTPMLNLLLPRAYIHYDKTVKFLIFDFVSGGDLSFFLHGRGASRAPILWKMRMLIAIAAGRGLSHLHTKASMVHGNLKASNVLLVPGSNLAVLRDFGLHGLFSAHKLPIRATGYCAPELRERGNPTFESDVYSFGVLLLELLSGKSPASVHGIDLPQWAQSMVRQKGTMDVFDVDLLGDHGAMEDMVQFLEIALACVATVPDARPNMADVVRTMEEIKNRAAGSSKAGKQVADSGSQSTPPQQQAQKPPPPPPPPPPPSPPRWRSLTSTASP